MSTPLPPIAHKSDGTDFVEIGTSQFTPYEIADIAYRCGYVFAYGHRSGSNGLDIKSYFFRRLYPAT
ncbi:hypothetical protein [Rhodococcus sp. HNM0569]|uniref:hypothetical protein n=1 Tax=Rhodococcus sp. HNM0569 TaxID=2716340 RepID=UPI00146F3AFC|nr:hypothetical protein [Rhodococcus sp. HNM0569]NLU82032.1 hypothetical protein [Rhodococcus sp. HNM0569]